MGCLFSCCKPNPAPQPPKYKDSLKSSVTNSIVNTTNKREATVLVVGNIAVGKTTLINCLISRQ